MILFIFTNKMESYNLKGKEKLEINQIKLKGKLDNLKSDFFLEKLFNNLNEKKVLEILKYNKNIKKRIHVNINDYKNYSEKYSSIEIEIEPIANEYGQFINIKQEEEKYYHIYFKYLNDNIEEINSTFIAKFEEIKAIKIIINYLISSLMNLFRYSQNIKSINFKKFCRNNITDMSFMFLGVHH